MRVQNNRTVGFMNSIEFPMDEDFKYVGINLEYIYIFFGRIA